MSTKKKDKKRGDKSKKDKKDGIEPIIEVIDQTSKKFYLSQVRDLEEKLERYQKKSDELELLANKYSGEYEALLIDKRDIVSNLKKELERKTDEILDLNDRLLGLQQAKDAEKEAFEKQLADLRTEFQETKDILTNQNNTLLAKLAALDEFKTQKEELLAKLTIVEQQIQILENEHQEKMYDVEKKNVLDKDRLKKDMLLRINQVAADFRRVSNKQMAETTKRTIRENVSINVQLQKMSEKIMDMVSETDKTKTNEKTFKQQIALLEDNEKELAKKNISNIKVIRMLTEKCKTQETMIAELEDKFNEMQENEANHSQTVSELAQKTETLNILNVENEDLKNTIKNLEEEVEIGKKYRARVERLLKQATDSLTLALSKRAVQEKEGFVENLKSDNNNEDLWSDIEIRDNLIQNMLILLNSAASLGFGPHPDDFRSKKIADARPRSSDYPVSEKRFKHNPQPSPLGKNKGGYVPHYQSGDLGVVPNNERILTNIEKMRIIHPQKELGILTRVTRKSVSTQTIDETKASVFSKVDFGVENTDKVETHPLYENKLRKGPSKSQTLLPITAQNRVTNKVF